VKIIISHDVDHLFWHDHLLDTWWPGLYLRTIRQINRGDINYTVALRRLVSGKTLHNIPALCDFLVENDIKSTFFIGTRKGLNLSYSYKKTGPIIDLIRKNGFEVGLHAIAYNDIIRLTEEVKRFEEIAGVEPEGVRTHYLRFDSSTHEIISSSGFKFDSSEYRIDHPYLLNNLWSIPISMMDVRVVQVNDEKNLQAAKKRTFEILERAREADIPFLVINFHDYFFSLAYPCHMAWFKWLISELKTEKYEFISFKDAVAILNAEMQLEKIDEMSPAVKDSIQ
jgi:peptidoglycan/xylan/chitin deacetylase (PgdA/CDA1 family)